VSTIPATPRQATSSEPIEVEEPVVAGMFDAIPAWGMSLIVHVGILFVIAMISLPEIVLPELNLTSSIETEELQQVEYVLDTVPTETLGSKSDLNIASPSAAVAQDRGLDNHREEVERIESEVVNPRLQMFETVSAPNEAEMLENIDLTGTTEHAGGTEGAVDRITLEIAASLRQRKTLPIWLFDESISLENRREQIISRFENVYRQLGMMDDIDTTEALKSGVIGYGQAVHVLIDEPTSDVEALSKAVRGITSDISGKENVFAAISQAIKTYGPHRRKMKANMVLIIVTDERGDDFGQNYTVLEDVVKRLTRDGIRVFCVGNTSPFGQQIGYVPMTWTDETGETHSGDLPADQGPETPLPEGLQLPFWTADAQGLERMSSGYGPYTLSRLCAETGGIYFVADDTTRKKWDPMIMRQYAPDYRPANEYNRQLQANLAKQALVTAAQLAVTEPVPIPVTSFQANNDNILREQITEAQKPLAVLDYFLERVHVALEAGEKHRDKLDSDRWRANYDLAMGRVLAMRVRAFGYNAVLAEMKASPKRFEKADSNQWNLRPSEQISAGSNVKRMHDKALVYLNRVIDEHPGTPWEFMAKIELREPLGWEWHEGTMEIAAMNGGDNARGPQFAPEEVERRRQQQEMQRRKEMSKPKI
jgi:hypothetical protein